jgi:D-lactate dehydrogenase
MPDYALTREQIAELGRFLSPERVLTRLFDRVAYANDASVYRLVPRAVVQPVSAAEVGRLFGFARRHRLPLTFRAAGTSLSGQAVGDGLLVELSRHWKGVGVEDGGARVRVEPGVVGSRVNAALAPHHRRIGPDPASLDACMMGGILANNASGMCCGVAENAYHTLESLTCVLPNGAVVDTGAADAGARLTEAAPDLAAGLADLRREVLAEATLAERIRAKYRMKNTVGYSLNALLDFAEPHRILEHLLIGSEGTLAFIAEAVLRTLPTHPHRATGVLFFAGVHAAAAAIEPLRASGARALELMDRASLAAVAGHPGAPRELAEVTAAEPGAAALLVEYRHERRDELAAARRAAARAFAGLDLLAPPELSEDPLRQARLWTIRKGLYPSVGAARRRGTAVIIEDVAFPLPRLADAVLELQALFAGHGYDEAIVFGHAKDGNLHFVLTQAFGEAAEVARYEAFMDDLVELVAGRFDGALKAEHGTGRNVAPFVETEWGGDAYRVMRRLKDLFDPGGLLAPGVLLDSDPRAHLRDLKALPRVEEEVDRCVECGFCERHCPSRRLTTTPRQRIVVRREIARLRAAGGAADLRQAEELEDDYGYAGNATCAADGLCASACPVGIDTGALTKRLRGEEASPAARRLAAWIARHPAAVEGALRRGLALGKAAEAVVGARALAAAARAAGRLTGTRLPQWPAAMPPPAPRRLPEGRREGAAAVYLPSCLTRMMATPHAAGRAAGNRRGRAAGEAPGQGGTQLRAALPPAHAGAERPVRGAATEGAGWVVAALSAVAERAGRPLWVPPDARGTCCGQPFASKGFAAAATATAARLIDRLWAWTDGGRLPAVMDASSCVYALRTAGSAAPGAIPLPPAVQDRLERLTLLDAVEWVHDELLPRLDPRPVAARVAVHPTCSGRKLGLAEKLAAVARACAEEVHVPLDLDCCATAGDRGMLHPELTASALSAEAAELHAAGCTRGVSSNLTCEIGLTEVTGVPFESILTLVEEASRPR